MPPAEPHPPKLEEKMLQTMQRLTASNIAGAIIAASGRPHSIDEALSVLQDVNWALNPDPSNPKYEPWKRMHRTQIVHK